MILRILGTYHFLIGLFTLGIELSYISHPFRDVDFGIVILSLIFLFAGFKTFTKKREGIILLIVLNLLQVFNFLYDDQLYYNFNFGLIQYYDLNYNEFHYYYDFYIKDLPLIREYSPSCIFYPNDGFSFIKVNLSSIYSILLFLIGYLRIVTKEHQPWELDFQNNSPSP